MKFIVFMILMLAIAALILYSGFALSTTVALMSLILAISADFLTTWLCYQKKGREGNPIMAILHKKIGLRSSFVIMAGIWVLVITFRFLPASEGVQTAIALVYWAVPTNNLIVLTRLHKKGRELCH